LAEVAGGFACPFCDFPAGRCFVVDPSLPSPMPSAPSLEQLLLLLLERDAALVERDALIVALAGRVAELAASLGRTPETLRSLQVATALCSLRLLGVT